MGQGFHSPAGRRMPSYAVSSCCTTFPKTKRLTFPSPYVAQGAAQAVEDAGALGVILSSISSKSDIPVALKAYQRSRKERAEQVQQSGKLNRLALHLPDGPEQQQRDEMFRLAMEGSSESPDRWVDEKTRKILWGHDAEAAALSTWQGVFC